jgi:hypothetical protein
MDPGCKEVPEQPVLLLPSRPNDRRDPVVAMGGLLFLRLNLLDELRTGCQAINNIDSNHHLKDVLVLEWLEFPSKDVARLTSVAHHRLRVGVGSPIRHGKLCSLVALDICNPPPRSLQFISGISGMKVMNQSIGWLVLSKL